LKGKKGGLFPRWGTKLKKKNERPKKKRKAITRGGGKGNFKLFASDKKVIKRVLWKGEATS